MSGFTITCRGARGSVPVSGDRFQRYGGATTCYQVDVAPDHLLLVDLGTGALSLNRDLERRSGLRFSVLLTHLHWDHTLAIPFFRPLFDSANRFDFYGHATADMSLHDAIDRVMRPPWFPVAFSSTPAEKAFQHLDGDPLQIGDITVRWTRLQHPQGVTAFRLEREGRAVAIATDVEHGDPGFEEAVLELARDADLLVYDAQYLPHEYRESKVGWGHSTWGEAVKLARKAEVGRLLLTSHDPERGDDEVDEILRSARGEFPDTDAAYEGLVIEV